MGTLLDIAIKHERGAPMIKFESARITTEAGVEDDLRGQPGKRQVTVLSREAWDAACAQVGADLPWTTRRANLLIDGLDFVETIGRRLTIGDVVLEITGETKPCPKMDAAHEGLKDALTPDWRGGVTCTVVRSGQVRVGDAVELSASS